MLGNQWQVAQIVWLGDDRALAGYPGTAAGSSTAVKPFVFLPTHAIPIFLHSHLFLPFLPSTSHCACSEILAQG